MTKVNLMHITTRTNLKFKRIVVSENIYQQLKDLGRAGDSFNDVLVRILKNQPILKKAEVL